MFAMLIYNLLLKEVSLRMVVLSNSNHYENVLLPEMTVLKLLTYYAQYYAHVKVLCLKSDCSIRVYSLVFNMLTVLLEYIKSIIGGKCKCRGCALQRQVRIKGPVYVTPVTC